MNDQFSNENWVDETVAADFLGLSRKTIQDYRARGIGPRFSKYGPGKTAPIRYQVAVLKEWAKSREIVSTSEPYKEA